MTTGLAKPRSKSIPVEKTKHNAMEVNTFSGNEGYAFQ